MAQRQIRGDAKEPCRWICVGLNFVEMLPRAQERFLAEVTGGLLVARHAVDVAKYRLLVPREERFEGFEGRARWSWLVTHRDDSHGRRLHSHDRLRGALVPIFERGSPS